MPKDLDAPSGHASAHYECLYLARGSEVVTSRPVFTGDVFNKVKVFSPAKNDSKHRAVLVVQHPCSLRDDGVQLAFNLLVAEVRQPKLIADWAEYTKLMPLPSLKPERESGARNQAALFKELYLVTEADLAQGHRVGCLSLEGVDLLLQRWIFYSSRVVVDLPTIDQVIAGPWTEAEIIEEWCQHRSLHGIAADAAMAECVSWLRDTTPSGVRQALLEAPQHRSTIRRDARAACRLLDSGPSVEAVFPDLES